MNDHALAEYKKCIDALVGIASSPSITTGRMQKGIPVYAPFQPNIEQQRKDTIIARFSPEQKEIVYKLLESERFEVVDDFLVFLEKHKYRISREAIPLAVKPFGTEAHFDFGTRMKRESWPDERGESSKIKQVPIQGDAQAEFNSVNSSVEELTPLSLKDAIKALQTVPLIEDQVTDLQTCTSMNNEEDPLVQSLSPIIEVLERTPKSEYTIELVSSLLDVFGTDTGEGVYWRMVSLIETYPHKQELYTCIQQATRSQHQGTRLWSCKLLGRRHNIEDEPYLIERLLQDESIDVKSEALGTIVQLAELYDMTHLIPVLKPLLQDEDKFYAFEVRDTLKTLQKSR